MFGPIKNVVFDFDGTLVDTMDSVIRGLGSAITLATGKVCSHDELLKSFGPAPQDVLLKWMPKEKLDIAFMHWLNFEKSLGPDDMKTFEGVEEMLAGLSDAGIPMGIFTGRDRAGTLRIAKGKGWIGKYFSEKQMVCGDDGHKAKPDPDALVYLLKTLSWNASETLMVGDHPYDMMAAKAAGAKAAAALWDLPPGQKTERSKFKEAWTKWDNVECDLRMASPLALLQWIKNF